MLREIGKLVVGLFASCLFLGAMYLAWAGMFWIVVTTEGHDAVYSCYLLATRLLNHLPPSYRTPVVVALGLTSFYLLAKLTTGPRKDEPRFMTWQEQEEKRSQDESDRELRRYEARKEREAEEQIRERERDSERARYESEQAESEQARIDRSWGHSNWDAP